MYKEKVSNAVIVLKGQITPQARQAIAELESTFKFDIVKIIRPSETAGLYVTYRLVT